MNSDVADRNFVAVEYVVAVMSSADTGDGKDASSKVSWRLWWLRKDSRILASAIVFQKIVDAADVVVVVGVDAVEEDEPVTGAADAPVGMDSVHSRCSAML